MKLIGLKYGMLNQHAFLLAMEWCVLHEAFRYANPHCTRESINVNSVVYVSCGMTMAIGVHHNKPHVVRCFATCNKVWNQIHVNNVLHMSCGTTI